MKGEIAEKLPEWNVVVGTREAVEIVKYLKDGEHIKAAEAVAAAKPKDGVKKAEEVDEDAPLDFSKMVVPGDPAKVVPQEVTYKSHNPESKKFVTIGERIHCISPVIREAMATFNPEPILKRAAEQIAAGATYLDVNIGPAESNGPELMTWAVKLLQENFNNVPAGPRYRQQEGHRSRYPRSTTARTASPSSTPPTQAPVSPTSTWPLPTTPSSSLCALPTASRRTTTSA